MLLYAPPPPHTRHENTYEHKRAADQYQQTTQQARAAGLLPVTTRHAAKPLFGQTVLFT